jgi:flagellar basal-body rod protein FlgB
MPIDPLSNTPGTQLLKLALDAASLRHQVTSTNIANSATTNYQPLRVNFEEQLRREMSLSDAPGRSISIFGQRADMATRIAPRIEADPTASSVAIDREMANLSRNAIHYQALLKVLNSKLELTGMAINDGRR